MFPLGKYNHATTKNITTHKKPQKSVQIVLKAHAFKSMLPKTSIFSRETDKRMTQTDTRRKSNIRHIFRRRSGRPKTSRGRSIYVL